MADSAGPRFAAIVITMTVMAFVVMCLRIFIRTFVVGSFGRDDWFIIAAMAFTMIMSAMMIAQVHYGLGKHAVDVPIHDQIDLSKYFYISVIFYNGAVGLVKISILLQYLRIFATKLMQKACYIVLVLNSLFTIETVVISIFDCFPIPYFWDKSIKGGYCVNFATMWFTHASLNITFDIVLIAMPMPVINSLTLPRKQKIALMGIFALGAFACVTSILRLHSIYDVSYSNDVTYDNIGAALWSCIEINTAIICASLPTFKALLSMLFPRLLASTHSGGNGYRSRTWISRLGTGKNHHALASLSEQERTEGAERLGMSRRDGAVRTNCEKGPVMAESSELSRSGLGEEGIKVVTVVTQQQQRSGSDGERAGLRDESIAPSLTRSERGLSIHS